MSSIHSPFSSSSESDRGEVCVLAPQPIQTHYASSPCARAITPVESSQDIIAELAAKISRLTPSPPPPATAAAAAAPATSNREIVELFAAPTKITEQIFDDEHFNRYMTTIEEDSPTPKSFFDFVRCGCINPDDFKGKLRYGDFLPTENGLISLKVGQNRYEKFINANFIGKTLATQGPLPETLNDFWICLIEQKIKAMASVTAAVEKGRKKTEPYWEILVDTKCAGKALQVVQIKEPKVIIEGPNGQHVISRQFKIRFGDEERLCCTIHH